MRKEIIINSVINEVRIAITEEGHLAEYFIEYPEKEKLLGNVYYGKVSKIATGINAAFVDIGLNQDAFLHFSDVEDNSEYNKLYGTDSDDDGDDIDTLGDDADDNIPDDANSKSNNEQTIPEFAIFSTKSSGDVVINLKEHSDVLVQVVREPYSHKGMKVSTKIAIPGHYVVLLPFEKTIGISRKIRHDSERRRLRQIARRKLPRGMGCIIRTASVGKDENELINDWNSLNAVWNEVAKNITQAHKEQKPALVYQDMHLATSIIRDFLKKDISRVVVDSKKMYNDIIAYLQGSDKSSINKIAYYNGITPVFVALGIEKEIIRTNKRVLTLPNGGDIVIDKAEALTVIDVNTGRSKEKEQEQNALQTNIEAALEIAKQLRLRDIGGIIIIDFIDMPSDEHKKILYQEMINMVRYDKARLSVYPLTQLGLMQISRQRIHQNLTEKISDVCPSCNGKGRIISNSTLLNAIEKWLKNYTKKTNDFKIELVVHPQIANFLTEGQYSIVSRLMIKYFLKIIVLQSDSVPVDTFKVVSIRKQKDITQEYF